MIDESHLHVGHAGAAGGAGHFRAVVVSPAFEGKSLVERQRLVYDALAEMMGPEIHALAVQTLTPEQWKGKMDAARLRLAARAPRLRARRTRRASAAASP